MVTRGRPLLRQKCPYSELFWSVFFRILTEYGEMRLRISPYSVRMRENTDQNISEYGHFLSNVQIEWFALLLNELQILLRLFMHQTCHNDNDIDKKVPKAWIFVKNLDPSSSKIICYIKNDMR